MANPLDTDVGSELFSSYEAELKLVQADLNQRMDQVSELSGEPRKSAVRQAEQSLEEASDLVSRLFNPNLKNRGLELTMHLSQPSARPNAHRKAKHPLRHTLKSQFPVPQLRIRYRCCETSSEGPFFRSQSPLRQPLHRRSCRPPARAERTIVKVGHPLYIFWMHTKDVFSGTDRLERSSNRLTNAQRMAHETEDIGRGTLADLNIQRQQIVHTRERILESEGYVDRSVKTLRTMARR